MGIGGPAVKPRPGHFTVFGSLDPRKRDCGRYLVAAEVRASQAGAACHQDRGTLTRIEKSMRNFPGAEAQHVCNGPEKPRGCLQVGMDELQGTAFPVNDQKAAVKMAMARNPDDLQKGRAGAFRRFIRLAVRDSHSLEPDGKLSWSHQFLHRLRCPQLLTNREKSPAG